MTNGDQSQSLDVKLAGVVGWPAAHSLSPLIHNLWARRARIAGHYIPIPVAPDYDAFTRAMDALRTLGFQGVNVTIPHKEHALRYAAAASANAQQAGAANMLTFSDDGPYTDNSDISGFAAAVREKKPDPGRRALVLGAGGAARGVILALRDLGVEEISIANRTRDKADALAKRFNAQAIDWTRRETALAAADLLVNTTSLGMSGQPPLVLDISALNPLALVADIVYSPLKTPLLQAAAACGAQTVDGLAMLMHQAVPGFRGWFGGAAVVDQALRDHLEQELARKAAS